MLLKKERLQEIDRIRQQNQRWKDQIDRQIKEKQLKKHNQSMIKQQQQKIEDQKIKQYQRLINERAREGSYSKGKKETKNNPIRSTAQSDSLIPAPQKQKTEKIKTHSSKRKISINADEDIPLFPAIQSGKAVVTTQAIKLSKSDQDVIVLSFPEQSSRKKRKSTTRKRQDTVQSRKETQTVNEIDNEVFQQQNRRLKEQLTKANSTIQQLMKMLRSQPGLQVIMKQAEDIIEGKQIGFTQYIKVSNSSANHSPNKLFPSLDFKTSPIINQFNIGAAKKAQAIPTGEFNGPQKQN